jgi:hypothetical protein
VTGDLLLEWASSGTSGRTAGATRTSSSGHDCNPCSHHHHDGYGGYPGYGDDD